MIRLVITRGTVWNTIKIIDFAFKRQRIEVSGHTLSLCLKRKLNREHQICDLFNWSRNSWSHNWEEHLKIIWPISEDELLPALKWKPSGDHSLRVAGVWVVGSHTSQGHGSGIHTRFAWWRDECSLLAVHGKDDHWEQTQSLLHNKATAAEDSTYRSFDWAQGRVFPAPATLVFLSHLRKRRAMKLLWRPHLKDTGPVKDWNLVTRL